MVARQEMKGRHIGEKDLPFWRRESHVSYVLALGLVLLGLALALILQT